MTPELGWFYIDEKWDLFIDGEHEKDVHVDFINVGEKAHGDGYVIKHFDRAGELLTTVTVDEEDLSDVVGSRSPTDRPAHI